MREHTPVDSFSTELYVTWEIKNRIKRKVIFHSTTVARLISACSTQLIEYTYTLPYAGAISFQFIRLLREEIVQKLFLSTHVILRVAQGNMGFEEGGKLG